MPHPYLPDLVETNVNALALPAMPGVWDAEQAGPRLSYLADAIAVQPNVTRIYSVPDPWARVILFDRALYDTRHALHSQVLGEWRGLLAILGLREQRRLHSLKVQFVDLALSRTDGSGSFAKVIEKLKPIDEDLIDPSTTFQQFYLLKWERQPRGQNKPRVFAMTSPATLVATGAYYSDVLDLKEIPWFDGELLTDPISRLTDTEKTALAEWIRWILAQMRGVHDSVRRGPLLELLTDFATDLDQNAKAPANADFLSKNELGVDKGIFVHLNRAHRGQNALLTEVQIVTRNPTRQNYLLIDSKITKYMSGRDPNEIVVFQNYSLESARTLIKRKESSFRFEDQPSPRIGVTPDFFFQESLIYESTNVRGPQDVDDHGAFPGCYRAKSASNSSLPSGEVREIVFPLSEAATDLFTPEELARNFEVQWLADGGAICRLALKVRSVANAEAEHLSSPSTTEYNVTIEKEYGKADLIRLRRPPALCVWPDFRFEDDAAKNNRWKRYYLFESWRGMPGTDEFVVRPLQGDATQQRMISLGKDDTFQIYPLDRFPEVLVCQMPFGNKPRSTDDKPPQGLLLLKAPPKQPATHAQRVVVGVDFGTTGTSVYRAIDGADGQPQIARVTFKDRLFRVTDFDANQFRRLTRQSFIPGVDWNAGRILSVFQAFETDKPDSLMAVRDGHVLFADDESATFILGADGSIRSNMKWGDVQENAAAQSFLSQICMETAAELVSNGADDIRIRYSYPTAFARRDKDRWNGNWTRIIQNIAAITSVPVHLDNNDVHSREAVAATRYFSSAHALAVARGALTLDIGGGTTDLAVWHRNEDRTPALMAHLSVLFAGRELFLQPLSVKPDVLWQLDNAVPIDTLHAKRQAGAGDAYWAQLNAIIAAHGDKMIKEIALRHSIPIVEEFLKFLEIGLCGIAFYSGLLVGKLIQEGIYRPGTTVPIFVGGNGSKLFHWCALGNFDNQSSFHDSFARSFLAGAKVAAPQLKAEVEVHVSGLPKEEVAYGLVARHMPLDISERFTEPLAGEKFIVHGSEPKPQEWSESVDPEYIASNLLEVDSTLPIFRKFLDSLDRTHLGIRINDAEIEKIVGIIENSFSEASHEMSNSGDNPADTKAAASLRRSPVFFKALKAFLDTRIQKLVQHE